MYDFVLWKLCQKDIWEEKIKLKFFLWFYDANIEKIILKLKIHCGINFTNTQEVPFLKEKKSEHEIKSIIVPFLCE